MYMMTRGHLYAWFQDNKIIWVTVLASIAAIQVFVIMSFVIYMHISFDFATR